MTINDNGVLGDFMPSRLRILFNGGERKFIPNCCLKCSKRKGLKCKIGLNLPLTKGSCARWEQI